MGAVDFKPWSLELTIHDLAIAKARQTGLQPPSAGQSPQLKIKRLYMDAELESLLRLAPVVAALVVDEPVASLIYLGQGRYDIDDIFARLATNAQPKPADEAPQFVLNQLSFGDKVEGSTASLPVKRAVALLADRNGVIDLDLPISGSLNDPQFRLGRAARGRMDTARRS